MNFVKFLENHYQELTFKNSKAIDAFNIYIDSEIQATHKILTGYRWFVKWLMVPKVYLNFLKVKLHLIPEPQPVLINQMKEQQQAKKAAEELLKNSNVTPIQPVSNGSVPTA